MTDAQIMEKAKEVLDLHVYNSHGDDRRTVREFFISLLHDLWVLKEQFNGKRPGRNDSDWDCNIYIPMIKAGIVDGKYEDYMIHKLDQKTADEIVLKAIELI